MSGEDTKTIRSNCEAKRSATQPSHFTRAIHGRMSAQHVMLGARKHNRAQYLVLMVGL